MASEIQYRVFLKVHDEESTRLSELVTRAKVYLSIVTFFLGAVGFAANRQIDGHENLSLTLIMASILAFAVAFFFIVLALAVQSYEGITDLELVIEEEFAEQEPSDDEFLANRLVDLAVAANRNASLNDRRAVHLQRATYVMLFGIVLAVSALAPTIVPDVTVLEELLIAIVGILGIMLALRLLSGGSTAQVGVEDDEEEIGQEEDDEEELSEETCDSQEEEGQAGVV